jgi:hypothetical protein
MNLEVQGFATFFSENTDAGDYEIDADDYPAVMRLRARLPSAEIWLEQVGQPAAYKTRRN